MFYPQPVFFTNNSQNHEKNYIFDLIPRNRIEWVEKFEVSCLNLRILISNVRKREILFLESMAFQSIFQFDTITNMFSIFQSFRNFWLLFWCRAAYAVSATKIISSFSIHNVMFACMSVCLCIYVECHANTGGTSSPSIIIIENDIVIYYFEFM